MSALSSLPYTALQHMYASPEQLHAFAAQQQLLAQQQHGEGEEVLGSTGGSGGSNKAQRVMKASDVRNRSANPSATSPQHMLSSLMHQVCVGCFFFLSLFLIPFFFPFAS
jgi:hypothetical protein